MTFEGAVWESVIDANTWSPAARIRPGGRSSDVHAWSMEDDLGGATLRFTALYDSNLADPLA